ncbi:chromosome segregation protein SMC [bacterium]|nr:chromosome segregation protein SMC [bacterium]
MADIQLEIQNLERDAQALAEKDSAVARATAILPALGLAIKKSISNLKKHTGELEDQRKTELAQLDALNRERLELEKRSSSLAGELQNAEMRSYELKVQLSAIEERIREELQISLGDLEGSEPADLADRSDAELESELRKIDNQLRVLGSFNPLAEEEYSALEERLNYLSTQLDDLNEAKSELRGIIREIDGKIQTTFAAAFEDTKREFEKVFPILFPGGSGSLNLTKPEEGEEVGIDVSVRPAGKRIERMSLLSGGERSLAAMALLVAIFKARPSPFYVLDEVEAALDDTNLERLLEVLKTLGEASQLIIVTHQKRTMEIADALYGVSMGKDGVTKVMSQTLEKAS